MITCKDVSERASDLIDGELNPWQTIQMRLHLAMCRGCERFVGQMRTTRDLTESTSASGSAAPEGGDDAEIDTILSRLHDTQQPED
jgi:anti-sigma factor RsiW